MTIAETLRNHAERPPDDVYELDLNVFSVLLSAKHSHDQGTLGELNCWELSLLFLFMAEFLESEA